MGLLWPGLMGRYGSAIGIPFSFEGIFFLLEAVFTAIYLYGWDRLPPWLHFWTLGPIVISGILGALSVVAANSWMNQPSGYTMAHGQITSVDPVAVFFNGATYYEAPHMILAAYMVAGGLAATPYAVGLLRGHRDRYTRLGFLVPFTMAAIVTPFQIAVGDTAARAIASQQPVKFASMEYVARTTRGATGVDRRHLVPRPCDRRASACRTSIRCWWGSRRSTRVTGWDTVPAAYRPPLPTLLHLGFDLMVGIGTLLLLWGLWLAWSWWRHRDLPHGRPGTVFLVGGALSGVAATAAMEAGWVVTEVGRQPWTVYHVLLTSQAATTASGVTGHAGRDPGHLRGADRGHVRGPADHAAALERGDPGAAGPGRALRAARRARRTPAGSRRDDPRHRRGRARPGDHRLRRAGRGRLRRRRLGPAGRFHGGRGRGRGSGSTSPSRRCGSPTTSG